MIMKFTRKVDIKYKSEAEKSKFSVMAEEFPKSKGYPIIQCFKRNINLKKT